MTRECLNWCYLEKQPTEAASLSQIYEMHANRSSDLWISNLAGNASLCQVPQMINYQGRVAVGDPAVNFDGTGEFRFALVNGGKFKSAGNGDSCSNGELHYQRQRYEWWIGLRECSYR